MIILNFSHPLTEAQVLSISKLVDQPINNEDIFDIPTQFDIALPFLEQVKHLLDAIPLTPAEMQKLPFLVNLPSLNTIAGLLLACLHGIMGYFPTIIRLRPVPGSTPTVFEVAEIINLQGMREFARARRDN